MLLLYSQVEKIKAFHARRWITKTERDRLFRRSSWNPDAVDKRLMDIQLAHLSLLAWWGYALLITTIVFKVLHVTLGQPYQFVSIPYVCNLSTESVPFAMMLTGMLFILIG